MEERVAHKLLELGYDPERSEVSSYGDFYNTVYVISQGHLNGAVLFSGRVVARSNIIAFLENMYLTVSSTRDEKNLVSMDISLLEKSFQEEGICLKDIHPSDKRYFDAAQTSQHLGTFCLLVEDVRKNAIASLEFWTKGEMLYVPKRVNF